MKPTDKKILFLILFLSIFQFGRSQNNQVQLKNLSKKLADVNGAILILKNNVRFAVEEQKIQYQQGQFTLSYQLNRETYYKQFQVENMESIDDFSQVLSASNSPIGIIRLTFVNHVVKQWNTGKNGNPEYVDYFDFYFLKKDTKAFDEIESLFSEFEPDDQKVIQDTTLQHLYSKHVHSEFWVKDKSLSTTYTLDDVAFSGNQLYLFYREVAETVKKTIKGMYLAVIPFSNAEKIFFDMVNAKPEGVFLDPDFKDFELYEYYSPLNKYYSYKLNANTIPLFLKVDPIKDQLHIVELLNRVVKLKGGKQTLKLKVLN